MNVRICQKLRIRGRVQGVFFRQWTIETARRLGVDGWVCNRIDGSVEALAAGSAEAVAELIELCRTGPPAAIVSALEVEDCDERIETGFGKRPTH